MNMVKNGHYRTGELYDALASLGVPGGSVIYCTGNLGAFGFHESGRKEETLSAFEGGLLQMTGKMGTLVVPTHSFSLCNSREVFDLNGTRSETGPFTERIRQLHQSVRQFHPYASVTSFGYEAREICEDVSRHAYGLNTPFSRMLDRGAWCLSLGMRPEETCTIVHHFEQMMAVPYRYTKEFVQPVRRSGEVVDENFYLYVTRRDVDLKRDRNRKFFEHEALSSSVKVARVGLGKIYAYSFNLFERAVVDLMSRDIYSWLEWPPVKRPFRD